jgi:hypothetical protein
MPVLHHIQSMRSIGSRRKRDVASNYPLDASFLVMDDDDDYSFTTGIWPSSATARVKAFFTPRPRASGSPLFSRGASTNTSPQTPSPLGQSPSKTKGFKAKFANACRLFKSDTGYSPVKEDNKVNRVVRIDAPCPIAQAKEERLWRKVAAERQKLVDQGKRDAKKRKEELRKWRLRQVEAEHKRVAGEEGKSTRRPLDKHSEPYGEDIFDIGHCHDGQGMRQCRLSQIGLDA